jgi:hypothetical protein
LAKPSPCLSSEGRFLRGLRNAGVQPALVPERRLKAGVSNGILFRPSPIRFSPTQSQSQYEGGNANDLWSQKIVSPSAPSVLYTATLNAVHRSPDAATTWTRHNAPKPGQFLNDLQVDPFNANTITLACSNFLPIRL